MKCLEGKRFSPAAMTHYETGGQEGFTEFGWQTVDGNSSAAIAPLLCARLGPGRRHWTCEGDVLGMFASSHPPVRGSGP
jgi:hypothetical protein